VSQSRANFRVKKYAASAPVAATPLPFPERDFMTTPPPPVSPDHILQTGLAFWGSKVLLSAVELELFTELAKAPGTLEELQRRLGLHERAARDFLDALVALGFLERNNGTYRNTPSTDAFLDKGKPSYLGGMLEMANHRLYRFWNDLTEGLRTGQPQNEVKGGGEPFFAALYAEPARLKEFLRAMTGLSHGANLAIAATFPWAKYQRFVDVGGAQGDLGVQVALEHPHLRGIGFDLPAVGPIFEEYVATNGLRERLTFIGGDFFADALPHADVIMMGHILHDWDLAQKQQLIRKAWDALPSGGALIVYEAIIDDERRANAFGLLMSLNMLIETPGGFDYTGADCMAWMRQAGFTDTYVQHLAGPDSMVVGIK
jgi:precorrin-6B methylase 2